MPRAAQGSTAQGAPARSRRARPMRSCIATSSRRSSRGSTCASRGPHTRERRRAGAEGRRRVDAEMLAEVSPGRPRAASPAGRRPSWRPSPPCSSRAAMIRPACTASASGPLEDDRGRAAHRRQRGAGLSARSPGREMTSVLRTCQSCWDRRAIGEHRPSRAGGGRPALPELRGRRHGHRHAGHAARRRPAGDVRDPAVSAPRRAQSVRAFTAGRAGGSVHR
jgi:hypothetical protein